MKAILNRAMAVFALAFSVAPITTWAADPIVGTWHLVSWTVEETDSKAVSKPFGEHPSGMQTFTPDGFFFYVATAYDRKPPAAPKATDAEAAQLYRTLGANAGRYRIEGDKWFITPEVHSAPQLVGTEFKGTFEIKGDRLEAKQEPYLSAQLGKRIAATYVWERAK
jgi:hypothetical protein